MKKMIESFEDLEVYQLADTLGDMIWDIALTWPDFAKKTVGYQIVKSIGRNKNPIKDNKKKKSKTTDQ